VESYWRRGEEGGVIEEEKEGAEGRFCSSTHIVSGNENSRSWSFTPKFHDLVIPISSCFTN